MAAALRARLDRDFDVAAAAAASESDEASSQDNNEDDDGGGVSLFKNAPRMTKVPESSR